MTQQQTQAQEQIDGVIFDPSRSLVVVAGAGTGKTYRLVHRYLKLILPQGPDGTVAIAKPEEVLAVTFTRAAAAEMRSRVVAELGKLRDEAVGDSAKAYDELIQQVDGAPIDTLHGLCARLLRQYPELSGVPVNASPLEPGQESLHLERFVSGFIDSLIDSDGNPLKGILDSLLNNYPLQTVKAEISAMVGQADEIPADLEIPETIKKVRDDFRKSFIINSLAPLSEKTQEVITACEAALPANQNYKSHEKLQEKLQQLIDFGQLIRDAAKGKLPTATELITTWGSLKKGFGVSNLDKRNIDAIDLFKELETNFSAVLRIREKNLLPLLEKAESGDLEHKDIYVNLSNWIRLGRAARAGYQKHLLEKGLLRFNDLEDRALNFLQRLNNDDQSKISSGLLAGAYSHLLVDEFQDTNQKQVDVIKGLVAACGDVKTFYVGDPKQSIYRFRGADVHVFERQVQEANQSSNNGVVQLSVTRRTSPELARFFNAFFPQLLDPSGNGLDDDNAKVEWTQDVTCWRDANAICGPAVDLLLRPKKADTTKIGAEASVGEAGEPESNNSNDDSEASDEGSDSTGESDEKELMDCIREARSLAIHIRKMMDNVQLADGDKHRRLKPRDFAILLPKWNLAEIFREALEQQGIAAEVAGGRGLLGLPEIRDLINLIRFFADWNDDLAAVGVLRGPCFGLSDLGLYALARWPGIMKWEKVDGHWQWSDWREGTDANPPFKYPISMHQAALKGRIDPEQTINAMVTAGVLKDEDRADLLYRLRGDAAKMCSLDADGRPTADSGITLLSSLASRAGVVPTADLLADAIVTFRMEAAWLKSPTGPRAVANVWKFIQIIRQFEADGSGLSDIISWLGAANDPTPEGLISGESDAVSITTIHGAKGLEWPVVAVAGLGAKGSSGSGPSWKLNALICADGQTILPIPRIKVAAGGLYFPSDPLNDLCSALSAPDAVAEEKRQLYVAMTRAKDRLVLSGLFGKNDRVRDKEGTPVMKKCSSKQAFLAALLGLQPEGQILRPDSEWTEYINVIEDSDEWNNLLDQKAVETPEPVIDDATIAWGTDRESRLSVNPSTIKAPTGAYQFGKIEPTEDLIKVPEEPKSSDLGNMLHALMEQWNFQWDPGSAQDYFTPQYLAAFARRFDQTSDVDHTHWLRQCVERMAGSPLYAELRGATSRDELFHEVPLTSLLGTYDNFPGGLNVTGRIDLLFKDANGKWCVIDYKETSLVRDQEELKYLAATYGPQLALYREILKSWRPGEVGRIGLWLALAGKAWWLD